MPEGFYEGEIFCDHRGCQTRAAHCVWAESQRAAFSKARRELVRNHGWVRTISGATGEPIDLCPEHRPPLPRGRRTNPKEPAHA